MYRIFGDESDLAWFGVTAFFSCLAEIKMEFA
jgi:hypothetical protein